MWSCNLGVIPKGFGLKPPLISHFSPGILRPRRQVQSCHLGFSGSQVRTVRACSVFLDSRGAGMTLWLARFWLYVAAFEH
jgi:hypothetical protein